MSRHEKVRRISALEECPSCREHIDPTRMLRMNGNDGRRRKLCPICAKAVRRMLRAAECPACDRAAEILESALGHIERGYVPPTAIRWEAAHLQHRTECPHR